ncbi:hypothetical protein DBIPINDM_005122 [Mesorhizobium sp. AR02]|uniref:hypothetical protein n=1 Tax=Mesorhizobium sp. AR02 TaxID=2865837 RepID=UPI00215EABF1|nr:hypothetical protein [Mesorhizobium sp. AR02]UVK51809.1 hypothetical protein DBIPINDM_005122 [Mesorhizobium sp. AR02]
MASKIFGNIYGGFDNNGANWPYPEIICRYRCELDWGVRMAIKALPYWLGAASAALFLLTSAFPSNAESYSNLQSKGYKTGKLARGASGNLGWFVSDGQTKFFCKMHVGLAYVGSTKMIGFTSAGAQVSLDRKVYESHTGGHDDSIPQLADLKAGKLNARDVGNCAPAK